MRRVHRDRLTPRSPGLPKSDAKLDLESVRARVQEPRFAAFAAGAAMLAVIATPAAIIFLRHAHEAAVVSRVAALTQPEGDKTTAAAAPDQATAAVATSPSAVATPGQPVEAAATADATPSGSVQGVEIHRVRVKPVSADTTFGPYVDPRRFAVGSLAGSGASGIAQTDSRSTSALTAYAGGSHATPASGAQVRALEKATQGQGDAVASAEATTSGDAGVDLPKHGPRIDDKGHAVARDGLQPATVRHAVNMHSGPHDRDKVVLVVPANASIRAPASCDQWCMVEYQGHRGYIYKSFVRRQNG